MGVKLGVSGLESSANEGAQESIGTKRGDRAGGWKRLHNEEWCNWYFSWDRSKIILLNSVWKSELVLGLEVIIPMDLKEMECVDVA